LKEPVNSKEISGGCYFLGTVKLTKIVRTKWGIDSLMSRLFALASYIVAVISMEPSSQWRCSPMLFINLTVPSIMINPPKPEPSEINVTCKKCGHNADIILPVERRRDTDKLYCSKCGSKGQDLIIYYKNVPGPG